MNGWLERIQGRLRKEFIERMEAILEGDIVVEELADDLW